MTDVVLAYLAKPRYGGWPTFTAHLQRGLRSAGHKPMLVQRGNRTETHLRDYGRKIHYQNVADRDLIAMAKKMPMLITAVDKHHHHIASELLALGVSIVIHDPTELKPQVRDLIHKARVIVIRETMLAHLPKATFIPHPYARRDRAPEPARKPAASISRIDFDKHTDLIVRANQLLAEPIHIYGFLNTMYAHHKLRPIDEGWQANYHGKFNSDDLWAACDVAAQYERIVDMSAIKGDGGGTQYTFLEAADAGCALILNAAWKPTGKLRAYAHIVSQPEELAELCRHPIHQKQQEASELLAHHNASPIADHIVGMLT